MGADAGRKAKNALPNGGSTRFSAGTPVNSSRESRIERRRGGTFHGHGRAVELRLQKTASAPPPSGNSRITLKIFRSGVNRSNEARVPESSGNFRRSSASSEIRTLCNSSLPCSTIGTPGTVKTTVCSAFQSPSPSSPRQTTVSWLSRQRIRSSPAGSEKYCSSIRARRPSARPSPSSLSQNLCGSWTASQES